MNEMLARLNRIYPNSNFAKIPKYNPEQWTGREYDSKFDTKAAINRWKSSPLSYEEAEIAVEEGYRIAWVVPKNMCVVDIDNVDHIESQERIEKLLQHWEVKYSYNRTSRGIHLVFQDSTGNISSDSHCKCALNIDIDTRANTTGYIILPCNDPYRSWGMWNDYVEDIPYFLKPMLRDNTPSFIGMVDGDGRNNALFKWRSKLQQCNKLTDSEIDKSIRIINERLFDVPMENKELAKTVLKPREKSSKSADTKKDNIYNVLAEKIMTQFDVISFGDTFYKFNGAYYKMMDKIDLERIIHFDISKNINKTGRNEIIDFLCIKTQVPESEFDKDWYKIAVKNGILNVLTGELTQPNKTDINTIFIPWSYHDDPPYSPRIDQFMKELCNGDPLKMMFLYQIAGYSLLKRNMFEKFFIFQGGGGTGKSTFMNLVQKMVGDDANTSHVSLSDFDKDYYLSTTISKLLNVDDDAADGKTLENTGRFKSIISGNKISVRQIYQPVLTFRPYCTLMFSCNKLPRIMDKTAGLYRRIVLVELNNQVKNPDMLFMLRLTETDMEYFLYKAVDGIKTALEEGHFRISYSEQELLRKFKCRQSALNEWIYEHDYVAKDFHKARCLQMYNRFASWQQDNGYNKQMTMFTFKEDICSLFDMRIDFETASDNKVGTQIFYRPGEIGLDEKPF